MRERGTKGGCKSHGGMWQLLPLTVPRNYVELCSRGVKHAHISTTVRTTFIPSAPLYYRLKRKNKNKIKTAAAPAARWRSADADAPVVSGLFSVRFFCCLLLMLSVRTIVRPRTELCARVNLLEFRAAVASNVRTTAACARTLQTNVA